jgi:antitoxin component YwqK of YwqJK toxin-antitoxin module
MKDSLKEGLWTGYYKSGEKEAEGFYVNDTLQGKLTQYFKKGTIKRCSNYENGRLEGMEIYYYENGTIKGKGEYHLDVQIGIWTNNDSNGNTINTTDHGEYAHPDSLFFFQF